MHIALIALTADLLACFLGTRKGGLLLKGGYRRAKHFDPSLELRGFRSSACGHRITTYTPEMASAAEHTIERIFAEASKPDSLPASCLSEILERASLVLARVTEQRQTGQPLCVWCGGHPDYMMGSESGAPDSRISGESYGTLRLRYDIQVDSLGLAKCEAAGKKRNQNSDRADRRC